MPGARAHSPHPRPPTALCSRTPRVSHAPSQAPGRWPHPEVRCAAGPWQSHPPGDARAMCDRRGGSQASGQFVRRVEDRYPGVFELCQAGLGVAASGPQEHHALVDPITLFDDLLSLGVRPGTRDDERAHPGIIDHVLDDLRERLAVGKAGHIGRIGRPPEALQDPVDAVARRSPSGGRSRPA